MPKEESEKIARDIHKIEENIHSCKTEIFREKPLERDRKVLKLLTREEEKKRHSVLKLDKAKSKEDAVEKKKIGQNNF